MTFISYAQVYWADVHYVKLEIANSDVTDRKQLLRDIMLLNSIGHTGLAERLASVLNHDKRVIK